ncbi:MAG: hypothetical protein A2679_03835 [Candidatus Sungbacteria bacterium RIFCSPHIGHO2_01_FULL_54_26]|nr:MAG: hypothetical protein A2679_03835 [Candidatus Sungbacteria bacterium RIFCSPHIGHO2_01_FULL_54_26]
MTIWRTSVIFAVVAAVLIIVNLTWLVPALRAIEAAASVLALQVLERARSDVSGSLATLQKQMEQAAEEIGVEPERGRTVIDRLLKHNPAIKSVGIAGGDGKEILRIDRFRFVSPADLGVYAEERSFTEARDGSASFGDIFVSPELEPHMTLAVPVRRGGRVAQALIGDLNVRGLVSAIHAPPTRTGDIYVVDREGNQIIHPDLSELLRRPYFGDRAIVRRVIDGAVTANGLAPEDGYRSEVGEHMFAVGMPVGIADLSIFFEQPRSIALAGQRQMIFLAGITVLLGAVIAAVVIVANMRLTRLNTVLEERNQESVVSAKILVRRDRELVAANARLRDLLLELESVGKMLVRRDLELSRANARLEELDVIKSEFVSIAAHQLRTPLTGVRWSYQTILDRDGASLTPEQRRLLTSGLGATLRMIDLVNDLLSVARIEEGRFGIRLRTQSITPLLEQFITRYAMLGKEKGISFALELPKDKPLPDLVFDEERIAMVLDNFLDNALKYTEPGGTVVMRAIEDHARIAVSVQDSGIGITPSQLHRVFTKFFRADNAIRLHTSGTGLGLYVAKNIIEKHDGAIDVKSEEGKGTIFSFTLPIA